MANVIEVSQLYKSFGQIKALRGITFSVAQNEIFGYLAACRRDKHNYNWDSTLSVNWPLNVAEAARIGMFQG